MSQKPPLTIALLLGTPGTTWGGMEKHTAELASGLADRGHSVHVIAHPDYRARFSPSVHFHPFPVQLGRRNPWGRWQILRQLRDLRPHAIHAQGNKAASLIRSGGSAGAVKLATAHGTKSSYSAFSGLDGVIAVSDAIALEIPNSRCRVIYNGVRQGTPETPPTFQLPDAQPFALAAGRLEPVKQYDRLIRAWKQAAPPIPLYILGEGSQRSELERLVRSLMLDEKVFLPGYENNTLPWIRAASLCLISSSREGFPYILAESLVNGCPVLSTPVNGSLEVLPEDCLAESTSTESITGLLNRYSRDPDRIRQRLQPVFAQARQEFTSDAMVKKTESFYLELLNDRGAR